MTFQRSSSRGIYLWHFERSSESQLDCYIFIFKTIFIVYLVIFLRSQGFDVKWVDDTHAIGVFASSIAARDGLALKHPLLKVRSIQDATRATKVKIKKSSGKKNNNSIRWRKQPSARVSPCRVFTALQGATTNCCVGCSQHGSRCSRSSVEGFARGARRRTTQAARSER